VGLF